MISIVSVLVVIFLSILITRIATIALTHTGLTRESAKFQARSAFSGAGLTTSESELVVNHPLRRKIVKFNIHLKPPTGGESWPIIKALPITKTRPRNGSRPWGR